MRRRIILISFPLAMIFAAAAAIAYFIWWDATHCVICRSRLDESGGCPNPDCHFGRLADEEAENQRM